MPCSSMAKHTSARVWNNTRRPRRSGSNVSSERKPVLWATIWFPGSRQAQPYRKLMVGAQRSDAVMGLHAVENVAAASSRSRTGEGEIMPSPSAPVTDQRSSADAGGKGVHGEFVDGCW